MYLHIYKILLIYDYLPNTLENQVCVTQKICYEIRKVLVICDTARNQPEDEFDDLPT